MALRYSRAVPTANRSVRFSAEVIYSQRRTLTDCLPQCCVSALWLSVCGQTSPYFSHNVPGRDETRRAGKPSGFVDSVWWTMLDLNQRPPACETALETASLRVIVVIPVGCKSTHLHWIGHSCHFWHSE